jgi:hypothetical protein
MDKKYNEFRVVGRVEKGKFHIIKKESTEREHVMISDRDAEINNMQTRSTGLHYELAEVKKPGRKPAKSE